MSTPPLSLSSLDEDAPPPGWDRPALSAAGYRATCVLNTGTFGTVLRAIGLETGRHVAVKAVDKARLPEKERAVLRAQAAVLRALAAHRYVVSFLDTFEDTDYCYHVYEFLGGGDLYDRLEARGRPFSEAQVLFLARQVFYAVAFLHARGLVHRDIKLENFVFETHPMDRRQVMKLIDFDLLLVRGKNAPHSQTSNDMCGTILYVSPDVASAREHVPEESDMWACGVLLYCLLTYQMPFQGTSGRQILRAIRSTEPYFGNKLWSGVSRDTRQLVRELLDKSGASRPTAEQALQRVKKIQARAQAPRTSRGLSHIRRSLRSASVNLWDASGKIVRRASARLSVDDRRASSASFSPSRVSSGVFNATPRSTVSADVAECVAFGGAFEEEQKQLFGKNSALTPGSGRTTRQSEGEKSIPSSRSRVARMSHLAHGPDARRAADDSGEPNASPPSNAGSSAASADDIPAPERPESEADAPAIDLPRQRGSTVFGGGSRSELRTSRWKGRREKKHGRSGVGTFLRNVLGRGRAARGDGAGNGDEGRGGTRFSRSISGISGTMSSRFSTMDRDIANAGLYT